MAKAEVASAEVVSVEIPMTFKKRGGRKVIVLPDGTHGNPAPMATIDNTMIKAVARAFRWQKLLENGTYGCLDEIAKAEKIGPSFVSRVIRLALLAPDIVEAILAGKQPAHLTLSQMRATGTVGSLSLSGGLGHICLRRLRYAVTGLCARYCVTLG
jgi:hypothetical protein